MALLQVGNEGSLGSRQEKMWAEWGFIVKDKSIALILRESTEGGIGLRSSFLNTGCILSGSTGSHLKLCTVDKKEKFPLDVLISNCV